MRVTPKDSSKTVLFACQCSTVTPVFKSALIHACVLALLAEGWVAPRAPLAAGLHLVSAGSAAPRPCTAALLPRLAVRLLFCDDQLKSAVPFSLLISNLNTASEGPWPVWRRWLEHPPIN